MNLRRKLPAGAASAESSANKASWRQVREDVITALEKDAREWGTRSGLRGLADHFATYAENTLKAVIANEEAGREDPSTLEKRIARVECKIASLETPVATIEAVPDATGRGVTVGKQRAKMAAAATGILLVLTATTFALAAPSDAATLLRRDPLVAVGVGVVLVAALTAGVLLVAWRAARGRRDDPVAAQAAEWASHRATLERLRGEESSLRDRLIEAIGRREAAAFWVETNKARLVAMYYEYRGRASAAANRNYEEERHA